MKVTVIEVFQDKYTKENYPVGKTIELADKTRIADLVERKLIQVAEDTEAEKPKKTATRKSKSLD